MSWLNRLVLAVVDSIDMIVGLMSRRCFHCVEIDEFSGPNHVGDHVSTLIGAPCPLCGTTIQEGDVEAAVDPESIQQIKDDEAGWNPDDEHPANFSKFFADTAQGSFGDIASKLIGRIDAASRVRRRASCEAATALMAPMVLSWGKEARNVGNVEYAIDAFQVCIERGDERLVAFASYYLGNLEYERDNFKTAARYFNQAGKSPEIVLQASALFYHAMSLHALGDHKSAVSSYQRSVDCGESPVSEMAGYSLGLLLEFLGDRSRARTTYENVVDRRDADNSTKAALQLARLDEEDGCWAEAKQLWKYAYTSTSEETKAMAAFNLGRAARIDGAFRRARKYYRIAAASHHPEAARRAEEELTGLS